MCTASPVFTRSHRRWLKRTARTIEPKSQGAGRLVHCRFVGYVVFALPELLDAYPLDLRLQGRVLVGFVGQSFLGTKLVSLEKVSVGSFA